MTTECKSCSPLLAKWKDCLCYANTSVIRRYIYFVVFYAKAQSTELFILLDLYISFDMLLLKVRNTDSPRASPGMASPWVAVWMGASVLNLACVPSTSCFALPASILTHFQLFACKSIRSWQSIQPFRLSEVLWKQIALINENEDLWLPSKVSSWNQTYRSRFACAFT